MGWAHLTQHQGTMAGFAVECGTATVASSTIEVPTRMSKVLAAFICNSADMTSSDSMWCDRVITAGAVTVESDFDGEVQYLFIGLP